MGTGDTSALTVMHTDIHPLTCLRAVRVHCIASQKHTLMGSELRAYPLPNAICSPPAAMLVGYLVRGEDLVRCLNQILGGDLEAVDLRCQ